MQLPSSPKGEQAILSSIILNNSVYNEVSNYLLDDVFYDSKNKELFKIVKEMISSNQHVDIVTLSTKIKKEHERVGLTLDYLLEITIDGGTLISAESYSRDVYEKYLLRQVIIRTNNLEKLAYNSHADVYDLLNDTHNHIGRLMELRPSSKFDIDKELDNTVDNIAHGYKNIIKTGFEGIDKLSGGMTRGEITIIGGRPGHGKTTTMINMIKSCVDRGLKVLVFNREMTNVEMLKKLLVLESDKLSYLNVRLGLVGDIETMGHLETAKAQLKEKYTEDKFAMFDNLRSFEESLVQIKKFKPDIVFDDYIQLIAADKHIAERRLQLEKLVNDYKWVAKNMNCVCVLLSQLNRSLETRDNGVPKLSDLAESGSIEQVAENVLFIFYRYKTDINKFKDGKNIIELIGSKVRYGVSGSVKLGYNGDKIKLYNSLEDCRKDT
tara:strand:+ start:1413 stop:2723 length:1311 start_codon:yes stop_codon:yes gene_type:complete